MRLGIRLANRLIIPLGSILRLKNPQLAVMRNIAQPTHMISSSTPQDRSEVHAMLAASRICQPNRGLPAASAILSRKELAAYLGICPRSIQNLENRGILPRIKLGKRTVYRLDSVLKTLGDLETEGVA
jgi:hypothetical protein